MTNKNYPCYSYRLIYCAKISSELRNTTFLVQANSSLNFKNVTAHRIRTETMEGAQLILAKTMEVDEFPLKLSVPAPWFYTQEIV